MRKITAEGVLLAGRSQKMKKVYELVEKVAPTDVNILIIGESGCGKDTLAKYIHRMSGRPGAFNILDPSSLRDGESDPKTFRTLKKIFADSKDGTLFIDDISYSTDKLQEWLLSLIKEQEERLTKNGNLNVRIVAATGRNLRDLSRQRRFRQNLCDRLVVSISLPPLRERRDDILDLSDIFIKNQMEKRGDKILSKEAMELLLSYDWPGNVRELENVLIHAALNSEGREIPASSLPQKVKRKNAAAPKATVADDLYKLARGLMESGAHTRHTAPYREYLKAVETPLIKAAMDMASGNKSAAAKLIRINRNTLNKKLQEYGIE